jgi:hypothetical protein
MTARNLCGRPAHVRMVHIKEWMGMCGRMMPNGPHAWMP